MFEDCAKKRREKVPNGVVLNDYEHRDGSYTLYVHVCCVEKHHMCDHQCACGFKWPSRPRRTK